MSAVEVFDLDRANLEVRDRIHAGSRGKKLMQTLCREIGPRPTGSESMKTAVTFLSKEWSELGAVNAYSEDVPALGWQESASRVEMVVPARRSFPSVQCLNSGSGTVEGRLLNAAEGSPGELSRLGKSVSGAVVLLKRQEVSARKDNPLAKRVSLAQEAGAAAVLLVSTYPDLPAVEFMSAPMAIPVISVSHQTGEELACSCRNGAARVRLQAAGQFSKATCLNLIAEMGPGSRPQETVILSAHLDCHYLAPGAFDNLTGIVALTEVARALAPYQNHFRRTLRLIAFTGEEYGYVGSKHYVRVHADELDRIRFVLNFDSLFDSTAEGVAVMCSPEMRDYIGQTLEKLHPEVDVRNHFCMSSDYLPFVLAGIPAARPADWKDSFPPWSHTREDTDDKIPDAWLKANAVVYTRLLLKLLTDREQLPARRKSREEVRALVKQEHVEEALRWSAALPA